MQLKHEFLVKYLDYVEDTEPPRIYHVFSAISGVGAALGRRCFLPFGIGQIFPNNYITLVGPPATRKSTAIGIIRKLVKQATDVKFGPDDTSGQRQGLIAALAGDTLNESEDKDDSIYKQIFQNIQDPKVMEKLNEVQSNPLDAHCIYVCASELATFLGINAREMISFLTKMWDGEDHEYKLRNEMIWLKDPLISVLGGATPSSLAESLPTSAMSGGFMSRNLLIYANKKHKHISFPKEPPQDKKDILISTLKHISKKLEGPFMMSPAAKNALHELYSYKVAITDPRFIYYIERRQTHLIKLVMALTAMNGSLNIQVQDVEQAQLLLSSAEEFMIDGLGEFGLNPLGASKQKMLEFIEHSSPAPVPLNLLMVMMKKDMKAVDIMNSLEEFKNSGKIVEVPTNYGPAFVYHNKNDEIKKFVTDLVLDHLKQEDVA